MLPMRTIEKTLTLAIVLAALSSFANAKEPTAAPFMAKAGQTTRPAGYNEFCKQHRSECQIKTRGDARVRLTTGRWNELVAVNTAINEAIEPVTDQELFGDEEVWTYPTSKGDCEDFVLLKRRELIKRGWPIGSLLVTVVRQQNGDGHAVLTVLTDRGDVVLDNLEKDVRVWNQTPYRYVKRQSQFDTGNWVAIDDARPTSVGSLER
jgi:predicted transglutaminase-like cysteine proteinase